MAVKKHTAPKELPPETVEIELMFPVEVGAVKTNKLTMRRPKVRDRIAVSKMDISEEERQFHLFANLCMVEPESFRGMDLADFFHVTEIFQEMTVFPQ